MPLNGEGGMEDETDLYYGDLNEESLNYVSSVSISNISVSEVIRQSDRELKEEPIKIGMGIEEHSIVPIAMPFLHLYPIDNYTFGSKDSLMEIETSYHSRMSQLAESFKSEGMKRTVEAILLTYENNHPHVLLLQLGDSAIFKL